MQKSIKLIALQTIICLLISVYAVAQTVNVTLTPPADTTGACEDNLYTLSFNGASGARIVIDASLISSPANCNGSSANAIFLSLFGIPTNITNVTTYNNGSKMSFSVSNNNTATISYNAFIDCSVVPAPGQQTANVDFRQAFTDSSVNNYNINVGGGSNIFTAANIQRPILIMPTQNQNQNQFAHYQTPSYFYFKYVNTGFTSANIKFTFIKDASEYCNNIVTDSIHYSIGMNGTYTIYQANSNATIPIGDTLVIRQKVHTITCIDTITTCGNVPAVFRWRCNNTISQGNNIFCDVCPGDLTSNYRVYNGDAPIIKIERITPLDSLYDYSCMNDTTPFVDWEFRITNNGIGALDSLNFTLSQAIQNVGGLNYLSLIPASSFNFSLNQNHQCAVFVDTTHRTDWLCKNLVPHALHDARFRIKVFGENDTIIVRFKTMQCTEEHPALFNTPKYYSRWAFNSLIGKTICQTTNIAKQLSISTGNGTALGTHGNGGSKDFDQITQFQPTVTDLSVPHGQTFGDSATFSVKLRGLVGNAYDYQFFGCPANNSCTWNGWFRATVFCDTNLRIKNPLIHGKLVYYRITQNDTLTLLPDFVYYTVDTSLCQPGFYNYYFNMNSANFRAFMDSADFEFTLQSCCGGLEGQTPYRISFYVLPNPSNPSSCFTLTAGANQTTPPTISDPNQQWLPLNFEEDQISVHCPGCTAPGMIAARYRIERQSFYLRDFDNDNRADNGLPQIIKGDSYYNTFKNNLNAITSGYGDTLVDYLSAHFQDGDNTGGSGGYTYQQLVNAGLPLHFLQLNRVMPMALDTMNLTIDSVVLYIDTLVAGGNACIDCQPYGVLANNFITQRIVRFSSAQAYANCVVANPALDQFLFTFCDTAGGNLDAFQTFTHPTYPFVSFKAEQRYRLLVRYRVCGNHRLTPQYDVADIIKQSQVFNEMWMTGRRQTSAGFPLMPNTTAAMHNDFGVTIVGNACCPPADTAFVNNVLFRCETIGGRHYFASNNFFNTSHVYDTISTCEKLIKVEYHSDIAGYRNRYVNVFPFEYRPPALTADTIAIEVPSGYVVSRMRMASSLYYFNNGTLNAPLSAWRTLPVTQNNGTIHIPVSTLPPFICLPQDSTPSSQDSTLYWGDQFSAIVLECYIRQSQCDTSIITPPRSSVILSCAPFTPNCLSASGCALVQYPSDSIPSQQNIQPLVLRPNLQVQFSQTNAPADQPQICWGVTFNNPKIQIPNTSPPIYTNAADNLFIGIPLNGVIPALANWIFIANGDTVNASNGIIPIDSLLGAGQTISGQLCASLISCDSSITSFQMYYGWNCNNFPANSSQIPNNVCGVDSSALLFHFLPAQISSGGKNYETPYTLCDTVKIHTCFKNSQNGYTYPTQATLLNLPNGLSVASVWLLNQTTGDTAVLNGTIPVWQITQANMDSVGFPLGGLNANNELCIYFALVPECEFAGNDSLPDIFIQANSYCGNPLSTLSTYNNNGSFTYGATQCTDCWSITKTANTDTVIANSGNVTYTIQVCNNSATTQTATFTDTPPNGFVTSSTLTASVALASMQCTTFTVTGHFNNPGNCLYNVASVKSPANTTWKDSVCVTVLNACANTDTTFADSTFSSPSTTGTTTINGKSILVAGRYYVRNTLNLNNCTVYTAAGAQIIVQGTGTLNTNNTTVQACDTMWQGVNALTSAKLNILNNSKIKDANNGIFASNGATVTVDSSSILDCVTGIYVPPNALGLNTTVLNVSRSAFGLQAAAFKPNYISQPAHGATPSAGIEVFNIVMTLGGTYGKNNQFYRMNNGIVAHNSQLTVRRSQFSTIFIDSVYTNPYRGYAIVCDKSNLSDLTTARLTVLPEVSTYNTVNNCYRGIYTKGASFNVNYVHLLNVKVGMYSEAAPWLSTNSVSNCVITASNHGLFFIYNPLARYVIADYNTITINGVYNPNQQFQSAYYAIHMRESFFGNVRYSAIGNYINMTNARFGIYAGFLSRASIKHNNIRFAGVGSGIAVQSNTSTSVSCNTVNADYGSGLGGSMGINVGNGSASTSMYCNSVDSVYRGVYFGGVNPNTYLKGTEFYHHFNGLYLNSSSNISFQTHFGNRWNNSTWSFQAENANTFGFANSRFYVDSSLSTIYKPANNIAGWFQLTAGSTFYCSNSLVCSSPPPALTADSLEIMIANGMLESEDYAEESQAIAAEYLYRLLEEDSTLMLEDSSYVQFVLENTGETIGLLYDVEEYLRAAYEFDTVYINLTDSAYQQITNLNDSIIWLEEHQPANWETLREQHINSINFLNQTIQNIQIQREAMLNGNLQDAELINDIVVPENLPQDNTQRINEIEIQFQEQGNDLQVIIDNYAEIFAIASQCPYAGGPAVERARALLALLNDSIFYDDDNVCLQSGIYRSAGIDSMMSKNEVRLININPNPASNSVTVSLIGKFEGLCNIEIKNSIGETVLLKQTNCENSVNNVDISKIAAGFYTIKVSVNNSNSANTKLVIVR